MALFAFKESKVLFLDSTLDLFFASPVAPPHETIKAVFFTVGVRFRWTFFLFLSINDIFYIKWLLRISPIIGCN